MIDIISKLDEETARRIKTYPHPNNRASEAGHPCIRFLVLSRQSPELKVLHDIGLQRIFDEGNLHERAVLRELEEAGINTVEQQRPFEWPKFQLSGRIDAKISDNGTLIPLEIKSCSPNIFPSLRNLAPIEMINSKYPWVRNYPAQILLYMLMQGVDRGIIIFKNKTTGEKLQKEFMLTDESMQYTESILKKLEKVNDHIAKKTIPPVEPIEECNRCGFAKTICFPGRDYGPGFEIFSNDELIAKLERWDSLKQTSKEFDELDKELKEYFKGKSAIVGDFKIESKSYERTNYEIPDEIKKQFAQKATYFRTFIERL